jgi:hypothetical protein
VLRIARRGTVAAVANSSGSLIHHVLQPVRSDSSGNIKMRFPNTCFALRMPVRFFTKRRAGAYKVVRLGLRGGRL